MSAPHGTYALAREDGAEDSFTRQRFASYDEAYDVLERYYADLCCSDDRVYYRIVESTTVPVTRNQSQQNG